MSQLEFDTVGCELIGQKLGNKNNNKKSFCCFLGVIPEHMTIL